MNLFAARAPNNLSTAHQTVTVDVRDDIRSGREPFSKIMSAAAELKESQELLIIAPFEPVPLFAILQQQGFSYASRPMLSGDWEVLFTRHADAPPPAARPKPAVLDSVPTKAEIAQVDARGLEPPHPMVKILETLATLPPGAELDARTDRRPMHLYAQLEERGFTGETKEQPDGSFLTHIWRR
jgi:uncharacterized protein (DUF2249 family)